jgi:hypothetical protein
LTDIILALQANGLDPAVCEPDVVSLARFIPAVASIPDDANSLYCLLSPRAAYFIDYAKLQQLVTMRTFIIGQSQDRAELLQREIPVTSGLLGSQGPVNFVRIFDSTVQVDSQRLGKVLPHPRPPIVPTMWVWRLPTAPLFRSCKKSRQ